MQIERPGTEVMSAGEGINGGLFETQDVSQFMRIW